MTDPENIDDEFFDDLYNDDEPTAPAPASAPGFADESMSDAAASTKQDTNAKMQPQNGDKDVALAMDDPDEEEDDDSDDEIDFNLGNSATQVPSAGLPAPSDTQAYAPAHESPVASPPASAPLPASHSGHLKNSSSKEDGYVNCFFLLSNNIYVVQSPSLP